jgi:perosamine synthetase
MGYNFKLTNLQAAIGLAQLDRLDERVRQTHRRDRWYHTALGNCPGADVTRLAAVEGEVRQWADALFADRASAKTALEQAKIGCRAFWLPLHTQAPYLCPAEAFPNATAVSAKGLWLPSGFDLTQDQVARVADVLRGALD